MGLSNIFRPFAFAVFNASSIVIAPRVTASPQMDFMFPSSS